MFIAGYTIRYINIQVAVIIEIICGSCHSEHVIVEVYLCTDFGKCSVAVIVIEIVGNLKTVIDYEQIRVQIAIVIHPKCHEGIVGHCLKLCGDSYIRKMGIAFVAIQLIFVAAIAHELSIIITNKKI